MLLEAAQLYSFYGTPAGMAVRQTILNCLQTHWPDARGLRVLGYGYAIPYLEPYLAEAERVAALMPPPTGILPWPREKPLTVMGEEGALPFADAFFDRILVVHGLEGAESARTLLRQLWRVLAPEGRMLLVVPNRTSLWAQVESSPFACGRPYRRNELDAMLGGTMFEPAQWDTALYLPPRKNRQRSQPVSWCEMLGRRFFPGLAGVLIVEAKKSLYATTPLRKAKKTDTALARA